MRDDTIGLRSARGSVSHRSAKDWLTLAVVACWRYEFEWLTLAVVD